MCPENDTSSGSSTDDTNLSSENNCGSRSSFVSSSGPTVNSGHMISSWTWSDQPNSEQLLSCQVLNKVKETFLLFDTKVNNILEHEIPFFVSDWSSLKHDNRRQHLAELELAMRSLDF